MAGYELTPELIDLIAEHFRALAEPARLTILNALRGGEKSVSELMEKTGLGQANLSKHLQLLHTLGFVDRRREGVYVVYRLAGREVFRLCDIMCGRVARETDRRRNALPAR